MAIPPHRASLRVEARLPMIRPGMLPGTPYSSASCEEGDMDAPSVARRKRT
jgi:hypothetical protein